ncbi:platelet glycoprotein VI-like isoform 2-T2 [Sarcophilus harrisii]
MVFPLFLSLWGWSQAVPKAHQRVHSGSRWSAPLLCPPSRGPGLAAHTWTLGRALPGAGKSLLVPSACRLWGWRLGAAWAPGPVPPCAGGVGRARSPPRPVAPTLSKGMKPEGPPEAPVRILQRGCSGATCQGSAACLAHRLYLSQETRAQNETFPRPQIIFESGSVVMVDMPVFIRCRGPKEAQMFMLQKMEDKDFMESEHPIWNEALFIFSHMKETMAGHYSCFYQSASGISPLSESMKLAVAGVIPKPHLVANPGPQVAMGKALSFKCWSDQKLDRLIVYQDQGLVPLMYRLAPESEIELFFPKASAKHQGTYSCIGFVSDEPLRWSMPSDPLVLTVSRSPSLTARIMGLVLPLALGTLLR